MSDWYRQKIAQMRGQAPPPAVRTYQQPVAPNVPAYYQQPTAPQEQIQQQVPLTAEQRWAIRLNGAAEAAQAGGGAAHRTDRQPCPSCGSNQYFSRHVSKRLPPPAPHCYNCGFNDGLFEQGLQSSWEAPG